MTCPNCGRPESECGPQCERRKALTARLTHETITDEQIRELRASGAISESVYEFATAKGWYNRDYREQCAQILNDRAERTS